MQETRTTSNSFQITLSHKTSHLLHNKATLRKKKKTKSAEENTRNIKNILIESYTATAKELNIY